MSAYEKAEIDMTAANESLDKTNTWIINKVRKTLEVRGLLKNIVGVSRMFRDLDEDGTMELDFQEFKQGMAHYCNLDLNHDEAKMTFALFDANHDGKVSLDEFLYAILPPLSDARASYVLAAFRSFNPSNNSFESMLDNQTIASQDIYNRIDMTHHPAVLRNTTSKTDMFRQFLEGFESDVGNDVDYREFLQYCTTLSVHCVTDYEFGHTITEMFQVPCKFVQQVQDETNVFTEKDGHASPRSDDILVERRRELQQQQQDEVWKDHSRQADGGGFHGYGGAANRLMQGTRK